MIYRGPAFGSSPTASPLSHQQVVSLSQSYRVKAWSSINRSIFSYFLIVTWKIFFSLVAKNLFFAQNFVMSEIFEKIK
jgi:hypothetical protein